MSSRMEVCSKTKAAPLLRFFEDCSLFRFTESRGWLTRACDCRRSVILHKASHFGTEEGI